MCFRKVPSRFGNRHPLREICRYKFINFGSLAAAAEFQGRRMHVLYDSKRNLCRLEITELDSARKHAVKISSVVEHVVAIQNAEAP